MGKIREKQLKIFESPTVDTLDTFIPELWQKEVNKLFNQSIDNRLMRMLGIDMAKKIDKGIAKAIVEPEPKDELTNQDIEKAMAALAANDYKRTATEIAMKAEQQRQADFRNVIEDAQRRQSINSLAWEQQEALRRRGLQSDYLRQMQQFGGAPLNQEEFFRRYAQSVADEQVFKDRAKPKATEEEMRGILSMITAVDLIINFMNSGFNDFRGWLNVYINANLESYRERQATKIEVGGMDPVTEDEPRTILSGE